MGLQLFLNHTKHLHHQLNIKKMVMFDQDLYQPKSVKLLIPDNCFVLWNSKTIHANVGMNKGTKKETKKVTKDINRLTAYITFLPKIHEQKE